MILLQASTELQHVVPFIRIDSVEASPCHDLTDFTAITPDTRNRYLHTIPALPTLHNYNVHLSCEPVCPTSHGEMTRKPESNPLPVFYRFL